MQLSERLDRLYAAFPSIETGSSDEVQRHRDDFREALRKAVLHAEGLEQAVRMLEANQPLPINADALVVGLSNGKVRVLQTHRSLISHGFDDRPDRRFGDDDVEGLVP